MMAAMNAPEYSGQQAASKDLALLVDFFRIGEARGDHLQSLRRDLAEEAAPVALVASRTDLLNFQQPGVSIAIDINSPDRLRMTTLLALPPEAAAAAAVINGPTGAQGFVVGFGIHPGDHQHLARGGVLGDRGDKAVISRKVGSGGLVGGAHARSSHRSIEPFYCQATTAVFGIAARSATGAEKLAESGGLRR